MITESTCRTPLKSASTYIPARSASPHSQNVTGLLSNAFSIPQGNGSAATCQPFLEIGAAPSNARSSWMRHCPWPSAVCTTRMARSGCASNVKLALHAWAPAVPEASPQRQPVVMIFRRLVIDQNAPRGVSLRNHLICEDGCSRRWVRARSSGRCQSPADVLSDIPPADSRRSAARNGNIPSLAPRFPASAYFGTIEGHEIAACRQRQAQRHGTPEGSRSQRQHHGQRQKRQRRNQKSRADVAEVSRPENRRR